ncbi:phosphatidylinositol 3-kinase (macronuclear) [Tetrahymena thermophila SB210]|uniref:1-phosphatidylinositol 4-kinase n=1 Tax=Tetrahymena thermophila (strain SB210) TaxID=312017 RepID=A4VDF9_TETTS|nr:phosphatidylinositol 3-kinase [Tetrahymena thermophila SB210]EDK31559.2 phosphatidylinositol 3-kinase [Tetrahymena thermophila SB210]|eukprot:XP_001470873.2 phosphatidylinositol 3-kinase [Tetrahymena thermophila SB210]
MINKNIFSSDQSLDSPIQIRGKKTYGFIQRIFCCKCFGCCQEEDKSLLTSNNRKDISKRLISQFKSEKDNAIEDPLQILIRLYIDDDKETIFQLLNKTRINPDLSEKHIWRDDLEFYLPQICNFFVFHEELKNDSLKEFLKKAGKIDFFFGHMLCFYLKSVAQTVNKNQIQDIPQVWNVLNEFFSSFVEFYSSKQLMSAEMVENLAMGKKYAVPYKLNKSNNGNSNEANMKIKQEVISSYGTSYYQRHKINILPEDISLQNYINIQDFIQIKERVESSQEVENMDNGIPPENQKLNKETEINGNGMEHDLNNGFLSTIQFFNDLMDISDNLKFSDPKIVSLRYELQKINQQLPAAVYVPFFANNYRNHVVLNIVTEECKVFSTKERSPFYICLELYRSEEPSKVDQNSPIIYTQERLKNGDVRYKWSYDERLSQPLTVNNQEYQSVVKDIETGNKPNQNTKKNIGNSSDFLSTNAALLDRKSESDDQPQVIMQSLKSEVGNPETKKTLDIRTQSKTLDVTKPNSQSIAQNGNSNNNKLTIGSSRHRSFGESIQNEEVSGISCVYEKGMRVPSHYNLKDLAQQSASQIELNNDPNKNISIPQNNKEININNSNEYSESNLNQTNRNQSESIPQSVESIKPSKKYNNQVSDVLDLNDDKFKGLKNLFGEDSRDQEARIRKHSPFGHFKSWKLVHMIVKTGDNIKQEQFAVQLIYQFDQIFKMEELDLKLTPYEIVSLGPQSGILEMVKNSITLDGLLKQIHSYKEIKDLRHFFQLYYGSQFKKAQYNFCSSLAAYSLVCYFLQIKDRHNGNILLHKNGHIIHIDFGFFLSNAPGKGLSIEQNVPFKLLSDYISILGGIESDMFQTFRRLFFQGFQAACKHQDKILILVKMLYSGHGLTLPCFEKGEQCILDLEQRFNPPNISNDGELSMHCNMLINQSLDNWRARWYDKWQYFCQGIFY